MAEDKFGFKTTSLTMVEKLSRGEDWERFCNLYHAPIKMCLEKQNLGLGVVSETDIDDAVSAVFEKLKRGLQKYEPRDGKRFRNWLFTVIRNAIRDYGRVDRKKKAELTLDVENENGETREIPDPNPQSPDKSSEDWVKYLQLCAFGYAYVRHTWKETQKKIIKTYLVDRQMGRHTRDADSVAKEFDTTPENVRKIKERFCKVAREYYEQYKDDDRDFFSEFLKIKPELAELDL